MSSKDQLADMELLIRDLHTRADALLYHLPGQHDQSSHGHRGNSSYERYKKFPGTRYNSPGKEKRLEQALKLTGTIRGTGGLASLLKFMSKKTSPSARHTVAVGLPILRVRAKRGGSGPLDRAIKGTIEAGTRAAIGTGVKAGLGAATQTIGFAQEDQLIMDVAQAILDGDLDKVKKLLKSKNAKSPS